MSSRMSKYYEAEDTQNSRVSRNLDLYREISKSELDNFEVKSNATVIGDNESDIDIEKIKKILDNKYNQKPQRQSIKIEEVSQKVDEEKEPTREYDLNVVLEKAKEEKEVNYEEERLKKLRDTQFNILNNLNLEKYEKKEDESNNSDEDNLKNLINTIYKNENDNSDPFDILSELKGDDNTETYEGMNEEVNKELENMNSSEEVTKMINSFYTESNVIKKQDFDDSDDFTKDMEGGNTFMKIVIVLIILIFILGIYLVIKSMFL